MESIGIEDAKRTLAKLSQKTYDKNFDSYDIVYAYCTENLDRSLSNYKETDPILTVLSSSDQVFSYLVRGARTIDTFDINKVTYYYYELKKAAICAFTEEQFLSFSSKGLACLSCLESLGKYMSEDAYDFWDYFRRSCYNWNTLLHWDYAPYKTAHHAYYDSYHKLQGILKDDFKIQFYHTNVLDLPKYLNKSYQEINLSNIFDYIKQDVMTEEQFAKILSPYLQEEGKILYYIFNYKYVSFSSYKDFQVCDLGNGDCNYVYQKKRS